MNFIDFGIFFVNFWLPGVPAMPLGTFGGHLCAVASEKVDLESFWVPFWSPFGDLVGILFLLWAPPGTLIARFWKQCVSSFGGSRRGPRFDTPNLHENNKKQFLGCQMWLKHNQ